MKNKLKILILILVLFTSVGYSQYNSWRLVGNMPVPVSGGEAVLYGNRILILGGYSDSLGMDIDLIQAFDPYDESWEILGNLKESRSNFISACIGNDIYIAGGLEDDSAFISLQKINLSGTPYTFMSYFDYRINRGNASGLAANNKFYTIGGYPANTAIGTSDSSYLVEFDLESQNVTYRYNYIYRPGEFPTQEMVARADDDVYIAGGAYNGVSSDIYKFSLTNHLFTKLDTKLLEPRAGGRALYDSEGSIIILGGYNEKYNALKTVEKLSIYPGSYYSTRLQPLITERKEFMAAIFNNTLYVFGGRNLMDKQIHAIESLDLTSSTAVNEPEFRSSSFVMDPVYPNPFNPETTVSFSVGEKSFITVKVYSSIGQLVKTLTAGEYEPGRYRVKWNGTDEQNRQVPASVYLCRMESEKYSATKKMVLLK